MNLCLKSLGESSSTKRLIPKETVGCSARWLYENLWEECHPVSRGAIMARKRHFQVLVQRSSGQFIDATTVLKFVGADFCSPTKRPALTLKRDPTAFSDLDQLYTQMSSYGNYPGIWRRFETRGDWRYSRDLSKMRTTRTGPTQIRVMSALTLHMLHLVIFVQFKSLGRPNDSMSIYRNMKTRLLYGALHSLFYWFCLGVE